MEADQHLPDIEEAGPVRRPMGSRPQGGPVAVTGGDCGEPLQVELRYAHDYRVFEVEETKSGPGLA